MNKNTAFIVYAALAGLGIVGAVLLLHFRPDATATLTQFVFTILALVSTFSGSLVLSNKNAERIEQVKTQTNGTLSALREENDRLTRENVALAKAVPTTGDTRTQGDT